MAKPTTYIAESATFLQATIQANGTSFFYFLKEICLIFDSLYIQHRSVEYTNVSCQSKAKIIRKTLPC